MKIYQLLFLSSLILSGCVISSHREETSQNEIEFRDNEFTLSQSTKSDVMQNLGIPERKDTDSEGKECWEYVNVEEHKRSGSVIFLLDSSSKTRIENKITFVFTGDTSVKIIK